MDQLAILHEELATLPQLPEVDWGRFKTIDFQEDIRNRAVLADRLAKMGCVRCPDFEEHVGHLLVHSRVSADRSLRWQYAVLHETKLVEASLTQLKIALSHQNLELLPDYESRVEVLKRLKFIDDNSTVLLKGRVACEVS